jgi:hypothetical protein
VWPKLDEGVASRSRLEHRRLHPLQSPDSRAQLRGLRQVSRRTFDGESVRTAMDTQLVLPKSLFAVGDFRFAFRVGFVYTSRRWRRVAEHVEKLARHRRAGHVPRNVGLWSFFGHCRH